MSRLAAAAVLSAAVVLAAVPAGAQDAKLGALTISGAFTRATPPGAQVAGGYIVISNAGAAPDRLVSLTADISPRSELHEMKMDKGTMIMRPMEGGIEVPANGKVELKPGGLHIMFTSITRQLKVGEAVKATLVFEKAGKVDVTFPVLPIGAQPKASEHAH
ncbi:copper chaperone PCu(A)C [Alsobacter sp. R-9]